MQKTKRRSGLFTIISGIGMLELHGQNSKGKEEMTDCIYCGKKGKECTDEEYRCDEHVFVWQNMPEGDEYV